MKPVFTQEMSDNGVLPPIGMKVRCSTNNHCQDYEYIYHGKSINGFAILESISTNLLSKVDLNKSELWPLDTRTDKEKAIDDISAEMNRRFELKKNDDDWLATDDTQVGMEFVIDYISKHGVKWVGK